MASNTQQQEILDYMKKIKIYFNTKIYNDFLDTMIEFKLMKIYMSVMITRISKLFIGNTDVITGFNMCLQMGYSIEVKENAVYYTTPNSRKPFLGCVLFWSQVQLVHLRQQTFR